MMLSALVASVALMLVGATGAQAKVLELTGTTTFTPSDQATQFLGNNGVTVAPVGAATAEGDGFAFPVVAGFGNARTFNGLLAHSGGLEFTKGERSAVLRRFVAVRHRGHAVLLAQVPGLRGGCWRLRNAPGHHRLVNARRYCSHGRVIVLAHLVNLSKEDAYNGAVLRADLELSREAARLVNRLAQQEIVSAGAPLGTAESRVSVVNDD